MRTYRSKPLEVEAVQMTKDLIEGHFLNGEPLPPGIEVASASYNCRVSKVYRYRLFIRSGKRRHRVQENDWVVYDHLGEMSVVAAADFGQLYEPKDG